MREKRPPAAENAEFEVIVLGSDINAYGIARSFWKRYAKRVHVLCKEVFVPVRNSAIVASITQEDALYEDAQFLRSLGKLRHQISVDGKVLLVPASDTYAELISRNQDALLDVFTFYTNPYSLFRELGDRDTFYQRCKSSGIAYPKTHNISADAKSSSDLPAGFTFPLILKPGDPVTYFSTGFPGKKKVFLANDAAEFDAITSAIYASPYQGLFTVQEFIPGDHSFEGELHAYSDSSGKVIFMQFNQILLEEVTPSGIGSYSALITGSDSGLYAQAKVFLESAGYQGFSNFDLKFDTRDNTWKFFEINQRLSRSSFTIDVAGYSIAELIVEDLLEGGVKELELAEKSVLYTLLPKMVVRKYTNPRYLAEVDKFYKARQVYGSFLDEDDLSPQRLLMHWRMQLLYILQYQRLFGHSMDFDG